MTRRRGVACALAALAVATLLSSGCAPSQMASRPSPAPPVAPTPGASRAADSLLGVWRPMFDAPRRDAGGRVDWTPAPRHSPARERFRVALRDGADSIGAWRAVASGVPIVRPYALLRVAQASLARRDTAAGAATLDTVIALGGPWTWEALRTRAEVATARSGPAAGDAVLERVAPATLGEFERAARLARRARLRFAMGDTAQAIEWAGQVVATAPSSPAAGDALALIDGVAKTRGRTLTAAEQERAAAVDQFRGDRRGAARRLKLAASATPPAERSRLLTRAASMLRQGRAYADATHEVTAALKAATDAEARGGARLERARIIRDSGKPGASIAAYQPLLDRAIPAAVRADAGSELAAELTTAGRFAEARRALRVALSAASDDDVALRLGLLWLVSDRPDSALATWRERDGEAFDFWRAVAGRRAGHSDGRAKLLEMARRPGYGFYVVAARESLGITGWPGVDVATSGCAIDCERIELAEALTALGEPEAARLALRAWALPSDSTRADSVVVAAALEAAWVRYAGGSIQSAVEGVNAILTGRGGRWTPASPWAVAPWMAPPALDSLYRAAAERTTSTDTAAARPGRAAIDVPFLRAVAWQESRFHPRARSRSDALGLYQLKLGTAGDMARRLHDPKPTEETLFDPAMSLRYGREYLYWLLERFDGNPIVALSAYNSGPGTIPAVWRDLVAHGGEALYCELIGRPETFGYVRRIIGARAAYRELRPRAGE